MVGLGGDARVGTARGGSGRSPGGCGCGRDLGPFRSRSEKAGGGLRRGGGQSGVSSRHPCRSGEGGGRSAGALGRLGGVRRRGSTPERSGEHQERRHRGSVAGGCRIGSPVVSLDRRRERGRGRTGGSSRPGGGSCPGFPAVGRRPAGRGMGDGVVAGGPASGIESGDHRGRPGLGGRGPGGTSRRLGPGHAGERRGRRRARRDRALPCGLDPHGGETRLREEPRAGAGGTGGLGVSRSRARRSNRGHGEIAEVRRRPGRGAGSSPPASRESGSKRRRS